MTTKENGSDSRSEEIRAKAQEFVKSWSDRNCGEKQDDQKFWNSFLHLICGLDEKALRGRFIQYQYKVGGHFIDGYIKSRGVIIEQKTLDVDLDAQERQSDGKMLTPYEQAARYADDLISRHEQAHWIICCNFRRFLVYSADISYKVEFDFSLDELPEYAEKLSYILVRGKEYIPEDTWNSMLAGHGIVELFNMLKEIYKASGSKESVLRSGGVGFGAADGYSKHREASFLRVVNESDLNILCIRIVFMLFMEDTYKPGFEQLAIQAKDVFSKYIQELDSLSVARCLKTVFDYLDTRAAQRDKTQALINGHEKLLNIRYVNGGLYKKSVRCVIPPFTEEAKRKLVELGLMFDWTRIEPVVTGMIFESILGVDNEDDAYDAKANDGIHFTSLNNIHKLVKPLFLDHLASSVFTALSLAEDTDGDRRNKVKALQDLQEELAKLVFLDPACGSGNFLTDTYKNVRLLENRLILKLQQLGVSSEVKVSIANFHGIELSPYAVMIAKMSNWIAQWQTMYDLVKGGYTGATEFNVPLDECPIIKGDSLTVDWLAACGGHIDYIMGNPPFKGGSGMLSSQREGFDAVAGKGWKGSGMLDYCAAWLIKAARIVSEHQDTRAAFVTTSSIYQGVQATALWRPLIEDMNVTIHFARTPFMWSQDFEDGDPCKGKMASVAVAIAGICNNAVAPTTKLLFTDDEKPKVPMLTTGINHYLEAVSPIFVDTRKTPLSAGVPHMVLGSLPRDGGNLLLSEDEKAELLEQCPEVEPYIMRCIGAEELVNGKERWCLWFDGLRANAPILRLPAVRAKVAAVRAMREGSNRAATRLLASTAWLFAERRQPATGSIIALSEVSTNNRDYLQADFLNAATTVCTNRLFMILDATLYDFAILESSIHHMWMELTAGRLGMAYNYSNTQVYNTFPWPVDVTDEQRRAVENAGQSILYARQAHAGSTLAYLYNRDTMPEDLLAAHKANDALVLGLYGLSANADRRTVLNELLRRYRALTEVQQ